MQLIITAFKAVDGFNIDVLKPLLVKVYNIAYGENQSYDICNGHQ